MPRPLPGAGQGRQIELHGQMVQGSVLRGRVPAGTVRLEQDGTQVAFARDGAFILGLDRDAPARSTLVAILADGSRVVRPIAVVAGDWRIEHLTTLPRAPSRSPEFREKRRAELARIAAARSRQTDADGWRQAFIWPATGRVSGVFGSQRIYAGEPGNYHGGVDVARPTGTPFVAPAAGVVTLATKDPFSFEGHLLIIDHGMGLNSAFLHLSRIDVEEGQTVRQGQTLGAIGASGRATGPHLHWAVKWDRARVDPTTLIGGPGLVGGSGPRPEQATAGR